MDFGVGMGTWCLAAVLISVTADTPEPISLPSAATGIGSSKSRPSI
jgi:hypothetical protein